MARKRRGFVEGLIAKARERNDAVYRTLRFVKRRAKLFVARARVESRLLLRKSSVFTDSDKVIMVNPSRIVFCCRTYSSKFHDAGRVLGGDWDREVETFEEYSEKYTDVLRSMEEAFVRGRPFEETGYYKKYLEFIRRGQVVSGCRTRADLDKRVQFLRELFEDIRTRGYRPQSEIAADMDPLSRLDEVAVHIDRDGHFLFADGQHRLAIAKILNIPEIPVRVSIRHAKWVEFRREVLDVAKHSGGKIYQRISHPDLQDIPAAHGDDRIEIIKKNLTLKTGDVLDIGAHWGYFCHHLEEVGFNCFAVEEDPRHAHFLEKLRIAEERRFKVIRKSIFDCERRNFDVVLALNIFHHFIKTRKLHQQLADFLKSLRARIMFFEPHTQAEFEGMECYRNYGGEQFVDFILSNSCFRKGILVGRAKDGRPIYRLEA